ncbi:MAG: hypothetical protein F4X95_03965 [Oligoflexia bacterium]|nr:hypothetical protein [Oligoflexia bacterium]
MKKIKKVRFNALAGYIRDFRTQSIGEEVEWYEKEDVLSVIFFDYVDKLYNVIILGQDEDLRYRCVDLSCNFPSKQLAEKEVRQKLDYWTKQPRSAFLQEDDSGDSLDFLTPLKTIPREKLNSYFKKLVFDDDHLSAKQLISYLMRYYRTRDIGVIGQFQTDGFHSRIWELYLYAMLSEIGFSFEQVNSNKPIDFLCQNQNGKIAIEATVINPRNSNQVYRISPEEYKEYYSKNFDDICIKIYNALTKKLTKKYWEYYKNIPLVIALQDFHYPFSSQLLVSPLMSFLYGQKLTQESGIYKLYNIEEHKGDKKTKESNFWSFPDSENVSAVICNTQGTLPKFNRMGIVAGFKYSSDITISRSVTFIEKGDCSKIKTTEWLDIKHNDYSETWTEGLNVFHNPKARVPLDMNFFPNAHHCYGDRFLYPPFYVLTSITMLLKNGASGEELT